MRRRVTVRIAAVHSPASPASSIRPSRSTRRRGHAAGSWGSRPSARDAADGPDDELGGFGPSRGAAGSIGQDEDAAIVEGMKRHAVLTAIGPIGPEDGVRERSHSPESSLVTYS